MRTFLSDTRRPVTIGFFYAFILLLAGCGTVATTPESGQKSTTENSSLTFVDSTQYFREDTASISLRASFDTSSNTSLTMVDGYKFQFRTLSDTPIFISSVSIIAGGKRFFVEEGQFVLTKEKGTTSTLPLDDSLFIADFPSALLQFRYNNESFLFEIALHQLKEFRP